MFIDKSEFSNISGISITDTGTGALVGVVLAGAADFETSIENLSLQVRIEYGNRRQREIDVLIHDALTQAMRAIQHELDLCEAKALSTKSAANA